MTEPDAAACGPHCPDTWPHLHYYTGAGTRFPVDTEAELQQRPAVSDQAYLEQRLGPRPTLGTWLTTHDAAQIAGVSWNCLVGLLHDGTIPYRQGDRERHVLCRDLIAYLRADDVRRKQAADELTRLGEELGD